MRWGYKKKNKKRKRKGNERKNPRLVALHLHFYDMEPNCVSGVRERRKQAGPTLRERGRSNLMGQKKKSRVGRRLDRLHEFARMRFQDLQKRWAGVRVGVYKK